MIGKIYNIPFKRLNKTNTNYIDMSALSYELANVNFIGGGYNISTKNLQGTDSINLSMVGTMFLKKLTEKRVF